MTHQRQYLQIVFIKADVQSVRTPTSDPAAGNGQPSHERNTCSPCEESVCCKMQPFKFVLNDGFTSFHGARMHAEYFEHYRRTRFANCAVDVSNKVFFNCTRGDVIISYSRFSQNLWVVQVQFFGHFYVLLTRNRGHRV